MCVINSGVQQSHFKNYPRCELRKIQKISKYSIGEKKCLFCILYRQLFEVSSFLQLLACQGTLIDNRLRLKAVIGWPIYPDFVYPNK